MSTAMTGCGSTSPACRISSAARLRFSPTWGRLARAGLTAQLALAETLGGAHALARFARSSPIIVPARRRSRAALASLPVEALRLEPEIARLLRRLGLKRIGQLYDVPRASLERRFHAKDAAEAVLVRLDQALGRREEMRAPLRPAPTSRRGFPSLSRSSPMKAYSPASTISRASFARTLARKGQGARRAALWLCRSDGSSAVIEAGLSAPSRASEASRRSVQGQDRGDRHGLRRRPHGVLRSCHRDAAAGADKSRREQARRCAPEPLIDRLVNRLGSRAVRRIFPRASHIPELAQSARSALTRSFSARSASSRNDFATSWIGQIPRKPPRPPLLLARARSLRRCLPRDSRRSAGALHLAARDRRVVKAEGPERIAPEWWRSLRWHRAPVSRGKGRMSARPRDYYRIEDEDGHRYWVFREGLYQESGLASRLVLHRVARPLRHRRHDRAIRIRIESVLRSRPARKCETA